MIVDAHMHIWRKINGMMGGQTPVKPLGNGMIQIGDVSMLGMPATMTNCAALAEYVVAEFDAAGVEIGIVVQEYMDGEQNDYVQQVLERFPDRFFMHGIPDYWEKDKTADQARQLFDLGFRGLKLPAGHLLNKISLDDKKYMPIWELMQTKGYVLAVDLSEGESQAVQMENILQHYPDLRVAIGHFGMPNRKGWPGQLLLARHKHVYIEGGGLIWLYRNEGYPFPSAIQAILEAEKEVGIEKLMWGSDWPRTMIDFTYRQSLDFIRCSDQLNSDDKAALLGSNAAKLYQLPEPAKTRQPVKLVVEG